MVSDVCKSTRRMARSIWHSARFYGGVASAMMLTAGSVHAESTLDFPFTETSARYWQFVSDRVMGGVSDGTLRFSEENGRYFAHMTGEVSTANNGGFIQFRAGLSFAGQADRGTGLQGVRLMARGDGQTYYIHFRTTQSRRPWHYYAASFRANADWQMIDLPFAAFTAQQAGAIALNAANITSIGIVAYGRDHKADIAVASVGFYR